jgi:hypothetical protein
MHCDFPRASPTLDRRNDTIACDFMAALVDLLGGGAKQALTAASCPRRIKSAADAATRARSKKGALASGRPVSVIRLSALRQVNLWLAGCLDPLACQSRASLGRGFRRLASALHSASLAQVPHRVRPGSGPPISGKSADPMTPRRT